MLRSQTPSQIISYSCTWGKFIYITKEYLLYNWMVDYLLPCHGVTMDVRTLQYFSQLAYALAHSLCTVITSRQERLSSNRFGEFRISTEGNNWNTRTLLIMMN